MCIIAAKYLKNTGWVLVKNRDQDYVANVSFIDENHPKVGEILCLYDHHTGYKEGMNHLGMAIITTSLAPLASLETDKKDGDNIFRALELDSPEKAAKYLIDSKTTGFIFIATKEKLILIEAAKEDQGKGEYKASQRIIPKTETVVRTNHGIDLPWGGFQSGFTEQQDIWRKSSELRKKYAEKSVEKANTPIEMIDAFASKMDKDLQMNLFRVESKPRQMRTIFQWALVPSENNIYIRPVQSELKVKSDIEKIKIQMLDNEPLRKLYDGQIKHFCRIIDNGNYLKATQVESFKDFSKNRFTF